MFVMNETVKPQLDQYHDALSIAKSYAGLVLLGIVFTWVDPIGNQNLLHPFTVILVLVELVVAAGVFICAAINYSVYKEDLKEGEKKG